MNHLIQRQNQAACRLQSIHVSFRSSITPVGQVVRQSDQIRHKSTKSRTRIPSKPPQRRTPSPETVSVGASSPSLNRSAATPALSWHSVSNPENLVPTLSVTRPALLELPDPPPDPRAWPSRQSLDPSRWDFRYLFHLGKAYGKFFWAGVKNVWGNYKRQKQIKRRLGRSSTTIDQAVKDGGITFSEYELYLRTNRDLRKLVPFGLILAVCGEFTPLVVLALGGRVVPATCVIPKQEAQFRKTASERSRAYMTEMSKKWPALRDQPPLFDGSVTKKHDDIVKSNYFELYNLGLTSSLARAFKEPGSLTMAWKSRQLARHCTQLLSSAILVAREGGWKTKSPQDMYEWGNKYGSFLLRRYTQLALERGLDPVSEDMMHTLLPVFEGEINHIIEISSHLPEQKDKWLAAFRSCVLFPDRPDCAAQRADLEGVTAGKASKKDFGTTEFLLRNSKVLATTRVLAQ